MREAFATLLAELDAAHKDFLKDLRDTLGGHLSDKTVQDTLDALDPIQEAFYHEGEIRGTRHYRFALDLLWSSLVRDVPEKKYLETVTSLLERSSSLNRAIVAIDHVVMCYRHDRKL